MLKTKIIFAALLAVSTHALSQAKIENDESNTMGDLFISKFRIQGKYSDTQQDVCIAPKSLLQTLGTSTTPVKIRAVHTAFRDDPMTCEGDKVRQDIPIDVAKAEFDQKFPSRYGITFGGLVVPFKYQLAGSHDFKGGSSIGGYIGYRMDNNIWGFEVKPILFIGGGTVAVEQNVNGTKTTQNLAGLSAGIGLIGSIKNQFNFGLVIGMDRVNKSAGYVDNGKGWVALSIGVPFSQ